MPNPYITSSPVNLSTGRGGGEGGERPVPASSPMSANAPLASPPEGAHNHRAITKGVTKTTKTNLGKMKTKAYKGFAKGLPVGTNKKVNKPKTRKVAPKTQMRK